MAKRYRVRQDWEEYTAGAVISVRNASEFKYDVAAAVADGRLQYLSGDEEPSVRDYLAIGGGSTVSVADALGIYGDGSDGNVTVNAPNFTGGPSGLIVDGKLTRDAYCNNLTLNGGDLQTRGFALFVAGTLTLTSGAVTYNGFASTDGADGEADGNGGNGGSADYSGNDGPLPPPPSAAGGGHGSTDNGSDGNDGTSGYYGLANQPPAGAGGAGGTGTGGASYTPAAGNSSQGAPPASLVGILPAFTSGMARASVLPPVESFVGVSAAAGGGGGDGTAGGGGGGGAGEGGGMVAVAAHTIIGSGAIEAIGGAGGNGGAGTAGDTGGGGGGNGGTGGVVFLVYAARTAWTGDVDVSGGAAGTGGAPHGTGVAGGDGAAGNDGLAVAVQVL
jgi:hypothetical protein